MQKPRLGEAAMFACNLSKYQLLPAQQRSKRDPKSRGHHPRVQRAHSLQAAVLEARAGFQRSWRHQNHLEGHWKLLKPRVVFFLCFLTMWRDCSLGTRRSETQLAEIPALRGDSDPGLLCVASEGLQERGQGTQRRKKRGGERAWCKGGVLLSRKCLQSRNRQQGQV